MARFTLPRDLYYGRDSLEVLTTIKGQRALVVAGGSSMKRFGFLDKTVSFLRQAGLEVYLFENVEPDPSVNTVMQGAAAMRQFEPDWIVALGGGSAIDAAKAMWVFYEYPKLSFQSLQVPFSFPPLRQKARFIAIPSTSGTASEVTAFSVITDDQAGVKYPLADFDLTPDIAILDPVLAETMPQALTAYTGMDALTHGIEAYVSTGHSPFSDPLALKAISMVFEHLHPSWNGNMDAREQMHYAQCLAGMAFSNALLGVTHSMAHKTGAAFSTGHIPHGCANAIYLPYVIEFNAPAALSRYAEIARFIHLEGEDDAALTRKLCDQIHSLNRSFGIPATIRGLGVNEFEFRQRLPELARLSVEDACTRSNPRPVTPAEMEALLYKAYYGPEPGTPGYSRP